MPSLMALRGRLLSDTVWCSFMPVASVYMSACAHANEEGSEEGLARAGESGAAPIVVPSAHTFSRKCRSAFSSLFLSSLSMTSAATSSALCTTWGGGTGRTGSCQ